MKLLFVTKNCYKCVKAKEEAKNMTGIKIVYADTEEGLELAKKHGVNSVPTWVDI